MDTNHKHYFIFVHGYNQSEKRAREYNNILFRRMYFALGFRGQYIGFLWDGDVTGLPETIPNTLGVPVWFDPNVRNALETGPSLKELIEQVNTWAGSSERVYLMAHSLGNLVMWEAARYKDRMAPGVKFIKNYVMVEAAIWKEAFASKAVVAYLASARDPGVTYSVDELERHSWRHWFNQTAHEAKNPIHNIVHNYLTDDEALMFWMRGNDWVLRGAKILLYNPYSGAHYTRKLSDIGGVVNSKYRSTAHQIDTPLFPKYHAHQFHNIPAMMQLGQRFLTLGTYSYKQLNEPIGAVDWDWGAGSGSSHEAKEDTTGWRPGKHSDPWILPYMAPITKKQIGRWYGLFLKDHIPTKKF